VIRNHAPAIVGALLTMACSSDPMPDVERTQAAVLAHARCIDDAVKSLDVSASTIEKQAERVRGRCSQERRRALALKAVPVFEATVEEYDELQGGLAIRLITQKRDET